jgi:hypothetical protein
VRLLEPVLVGLGQHLGEGSADDFGVPFHLGQRHGDDCVFIKDTDV